MERVTIARAVTTLEELLEALNNAYWEANSIGQKDVVFDLISSVHDELNELAKLSVDDHGMSYEPITIQFRRCCSKLKNLSSNTDDWFPRMVTAQKLQSSINEAAKLISEQCLT